MMKKIIIYGLFIFGSFFATSLVSAETIKNFDVDVSVSNTGKLRVVETITYDFEDAVRHGIYRDIPVRYVNSKGAYKLHLSGVRVVDEKGAPYMFTTERNGKNERIKIGDPSTLISGVHVYRIMYDMDRVIRFFSTHDELYWNVTGNDWEVPIESLSARVQMPGSIINSGEQKAVCFVGTFGETVPCASTAFVTNNPEAVAFSHAALLPGEGLTLVVAIPVGSIAQPTPRQKFFDFIQDNWIFGLPVLVFIIMFLVWRLIGRDAKGRGTIIPEYDVPDNLLPSQAGGLIDDVVHPRDISADIIQLAILGYIKITHKEKKGMFDKADFLLELLDSGKPLANPILQSLLNNLFASSASTPTETKGAKKAVLMSQLKNKLAHTMKNISKKIFESLITGGYIKRSPAVIRAIFLILPIIGAIIVSQFIAPIFGLAGIVSVVVSTAIVAGFGYHLPARTEKGALVREKILGLKMYLSVAEKDRIAFHNAPDKNPATFEKFLPYAMVLKVEERWAEQFTGIYTKQPNWYSDPTMHTFNVVAFTGGLSDFRSSSASAMTVASSGVSGFSGGGSGGGFGGGGGGSW